MIENTKKGIMYGEWNDNGRLLEESGRRQLFGVSDPACEYPDLEYS